MMVLKLLCFQVRTYPSTESATMEGFIYFLAVQSIFLVVY